MSVLIVSGTGTDVGKTVATAALAACAAGSVAVVKPAQTGVRPGEPGDLAEVTRLSGRTDVHEFARYPDPLSPHHAAQVSGLPYPDRQRIVAAVANLAARVDLVIVEGAGGLLVPYDADGWTILDLASDLAGRLAGNSAGDSGTASAGDSAGDSANGGDVELLLVVAAGLGTLNHTALAVRVADAAGLAPAGIVIGSWPRSPGLAERCNLDDLARLSGSGVIDGVLPAGMSRMADFSAHARAALSPRFGGTFDWTRFRGTARAPRLNGTAAAEGDVTQPDDIDRDMTARREGAADR